MYNRQKYFVENSGRVRISHGEDASGNRSGLVGSNRVADGYSAESAALAELSAKIERTSKRQSFD